VCKCKDIVQSEMKYKIYSHQQVFNFWFETFTMNESFFKVRLAKSFIKGTLFLAGNNLMLFFWQPGVSQRLPGAAEI